MNNSNQASSMTGFIKSPLRVRRKSDLSELVPELLGDGQSCTFKVLSGQETIEDHYGVESVLYSSGYKSIMKCHNKVTGEHCIMKRRCRDKQSIDSECERQWRRVTQLILQLPPCEFVCKILQVFEDDHNFYIIMEECSGGQLLDYLLSEPTVTQNECKKIVREMLQAVCHLHDAGILHRDIKPENLLFASPLSSHSGVTPPLKLIDFDTCSEIISGSSSVANNGLPESNCGGMPNTPKRASSIILESTNSMVRRRSTTVIGTLGYIAPESFNGEYTAASDLFSIGVIFYILMTGDMPFDDTIYHTKVRNNPKAGNIQVVGSPSNKRVYNEFKNSKIDWNMNPWPSFPLARDLCKQLLDLNPESRMSSARESLRHPWLFDNKC